VKEKIEAQIEEINRASTPCFGNPKREQSGAHSATHGAPQPVKSKS
jgi:hypothetical protein